MPCQTFHRLDVVDLTSDLPERGLVRGQVRTILERLSVDVFEVEFCDDEGRTYALLALDAAQLMRLVYEPVGAA